MEFVEQPLEPFGEMLLEVSVPSDLGYKTPVVLRIIKQLQEHGCLPPGDNPRTELVLDEALTNAMLHGNKCNPHKEVAVRL
ncbi:MAG: hypothetical protein GTN78_11990, partial [Gemmatimonadales bacterium]|nr:hypothetical protein [Gemmatimonadales bacterium]NIR00902.1 hypothetical protein [Gemmatimonadales bacterium]